MGLDCEVLWHACWKESSQSRPQTKAYDLKSAYKQLPLNPLEQPKAVIVLKGPSGAASGFVCKTLPLGRLLRCCTLTGLPFSCNVSCGRSLC